MKSLFSWAIPLLACALASGCEPGQPNAMGGPNGGHRGGNAANTGDPGTGTGANDPTPITNTADGGEAPRPDGPGPGPSLPPDPNGFQLVIAPLLDAQGCTECHHQTRRVDLTTYPFMAGTPADSADRLLASLSGTMPPSPRTKVPASVIDQITKWKAAGMKP